MLPSTTLIDRQDGQPVFHRTQGPVGAAAFLADAHALAARLPAGPFAVNLCRDRYAFAVSFAAALIQRRTSLLNIDPAALAAVAASYPGCFVIADEALPSCPVPLIQCRPTATAIATATGTATGTQPADNPHIPPGHLAALVFTSGSTGVPVAHEKRWGALVARSRAAARQFAIGGGTVIGTVPPQHMYGFETTVLLPLHAPVASWCGPAFFPGDVAAALLACPGDRILVTTPLQIRTLLQAALPLPGLTAVISATAPLDPALAARAEATWGAPVLEIFGATECGSIASRRTTAGPDWTPYPGVTLDIGDAGATVHADAADPVPLADILEPAPGGFRLLGRRTDLVKLGGRRASLPGLNQVLVGLPGVDDGAFVMPDDPGHSTPRLVAIVVAPQRTGPSILADLRRVIDPAFMPRRVIRVDAMPRNALGKLPRQALLRLLDAS